MRSAIEAIDPDSLTWPMLAWTATEAALSAGRRDKAAEIAYAICERAYRFRDARKYDPERTLPGVACEYWPPNGRCGGEGYGWGAFTTHLVIHTLVGLSFDEAGITFRPGLPRTWRVPGQHYALKMHIRGRPLTITLEPIDPDRVRIQMNARQAVMTWHESAVYTWDEL
jgi:hypothetical protein